MLQQTVLLSALMLALATPLASAQQEQPADSTTAGSTTTTGPTTMSPSQMGPGMGPGKMGPGMRSGQMRPGGQDGPGMIDDAESGTSMTARWEAIQKHMEDIAATDDPAQRRELMQKYREDMRQFMADRGGAGSPQRGMRHRSRPGDGTGQKHGYGHSDRHSNRHAQGHYMGPGAMAYPYMMPPMPMMVMPPMNMMGGPGMMCNPYMMPQMYMPPMPMMNMMPPMHRSGMQGGPQGQQLDSRLQLIEERLDELQILLEERLDDDNSDD